MRCTIQPWLDTDTETFAWVCTVHRSYHPCPYDGEPAKPSDLPVHIDQIPSREVTLAYARRLFGGIRDIVIHSDLRTTRPHATGASRGCWCDPEVTR